MKISFSDKYVNTPSFIALCNFAEQYSFDGIEISNAINEKEIHQDSIFRSSVTADSKRKLINRKLAISALSYSKSIKSDDDVQILSKYVEYASLAGVKDVIINFDELLSCDKLKELVQPILNVAKEYGVNILLETSGAYSDTEKVLDFINLFSSAVLKVCWNIRETYFTANESADKTIQTLGSYIGFVRLGDKKDEKNVLIGDGDLPVKDFINALHSLNYDGYVSVMDCDDISSQDIILTHFKSYLNSNETDTRQKEIYYNRAKTGTHPWKKYDVLDLTFSEVLDEMVERYPDQLAFK